MLIFPLQTDHGSYIKPFDSFLKVPDAHISAITCEMMLMAELERILGAVGGGVSS